jgi:hypothetical protein
MMVSSIQGNTGYLGLPVTFAVLGTGALGLPWAGGKVLPAPIGAAVTLKVLVTPLLLLALTTPLVDLPQASSSRLRCRPGSTAW